MHYIEVLHAILYYIVDLTCLFRRLYMFDADNNTCVTGHEIAE